MSHLILRRYPEFNGSMLSPGVDSGHGEVVMTIGSSHRVSNVNLFASSDVAVAVAILPGDNILLPCVKVRKSTYSITSS